MDTALKQKPQRNMGIDLLRIVSMLMVVIIHTLRKGGILDGLEGNEPSASIAWILQIMCFGAVNLYALITGYVCVHSKNKISRIIPLWAQVAFYSFGLTLVSKFLLGLDFGIKEIFLSCFPVISKQYWYFTAYFCLFFFMPFLNKALLACTSKERINISCVILFLFTVLSSVGLLINTDLFMINHGYSALWLMALYVIGATIRLDEGIFNKCSKWIYLLGYFVAMLITWLVRIALMLIYQKYHFGFIKNNAMFVRYNFFFIAVGCVFLFLFFIRINIKHGKRIISFFAPVSFGVYIISEHPGIREVLMMGRFENFLDRPIFVILAAVLGFSLAVFTCCALIDYLREKLFKLIKINSISESIEKLLNKVCNKIYSKIEGDLTGKRGGIL